MEKNTTDRKDRTGKTAFAILVIFLAHEHKKSKVTESKDFTSVSCDLVKLE